MQNEIELTQPGADMKTLPPEREMTEAEQQQQEFMQEWRMSKFYKFVHNAIKNELDHDYLEEWMIKQYAEGIDPSSNEVGDQTKINFQAKIRIANIKETLS